MSIEDYVKKYDGANVYALIAYELHLIHESLEETEPEKEYDK